MKLYSFYSNSHATLKEIFLTSLQDNFEITLYNVEELRGSAPVQKIVSGGGTEFWRLKTQLVVDRIRENIGNVILFTDIDIKFYEPVENDFVKYIENCDMVFQNDLGFHSINIGILIIRCSEKTLRFWEQVLETVIQKAIWDQTVVNEMMLKKTISGNFIRGFVTDDNIRWRLLPLTFFAWHITELQYSMRHPLRPLQILMIPFSKIKLCHATGPHRSEEKLVVYEKFEHSRKHPVSFKLNYLRGIIGCIRGKIANHLLKLFQK